MDYDQSTTYRGQLDHEERLLEMENMENNVDSFDKGPSRRTQAYSTHSSHSGSYSRGFKGLIPGRRFWWLAIFILLGFLSIFTYHSEHPRKVVSAFIYKDCKALKCTKSFIKYESSEIEQVWLDNIVEWSQKNWVCAKMADYLTEYIFFVNYTATAQTEPEILPTLQKDPLFNKTMSRYHYRSNCSDGSVRSHVEYIEPMFGCLRDHSQFQGGCPGNPFDFSKIPLTADSIRRYMLLANASDYMNPEEKLPKKMILMDMGASLWNSGAGGASQAWFHHVYKKNGFKLIRVLLWEATPHPPENIFKDIPNDLIPYYAYYNMPISAEKGAQMDPWTIVKELYDGETFLSVKLDIDTSPVEIPLIQRMEKDPELVDMIDEFFFEYHHDEPCMGPWFGPQQGKVSLPTVYDNLILLRRMGLRYHHYP